MAASNDRNKLSGGGTFGDSDGFDGNAKDFAQDGAGIPSGGPTNFFDGTANPNQHEQTDWPLAFEPNKFPREKGHDSLTDEEATLS